MSAANNTATEFLFQLDEFYLDLETRGTIALLDKKDIEKRPFPGLRPFKTSEFQLFNGRDGQAEELISRFRKIHFLSVIGSSGTGKSSLVRAGLIPQLLGGYLHEAGSNWDIAICRPGRNPVENLAVALARIKCGSNDKTAINEQYEIIQPLLENTIYGILEVNELLNPPSKPKEEKSNLLVLIDQFEELFRFDRKDLGKPGIENHFVNLLLKASLNPDSSIYVVITMRSEFLGDCAKFRGLPEAINEGQYLVPQLSREQIKEVIEGPIKLAGKKIAPGLVELLVNEIEESKTKKDLDQLPILQHALMRTFQQAMKEEGVKEITYEHYKASGGMEKALANHAEEKYESLADGIKFPSLKQQIAKVIFQALTDSSTDQKGGRRPTALRNLYAIAASLNANEKDVDEVINRFRDNDTSFIMPPLNTALYPDLVMDISHESLMRQWGRLKLWMKEEQDSERKFKYYSQQVLDKRELLTGLDLDGALDWINLQKPNVFWSQKYADNYDAVIDYIERSKKRRKRRRWLNVIKISGLGLAVIAGLLLLTQINKSRDLLKGQKDILKLTREPFYTSGMLSQQRRDDWVLKLVKKKYEEKGDIYYANLLGGLNTAAKAYASSANPNLAFWFANLAFEPSKDEALDSILTAIMNNCHYFVTRKESLPPEWDRNRDLLYAISKDKHFFAIKYKKEVWLYRINEDSINKIKVLEVTEAHNYKSAYYSALSFPDNDHLLAYSENTIYKWDISQNFVLDKKAVPFDDVNYYISVISPDGGALAVNDNQYSVKIWDINKKTYAMPGIRLDATDGHVTKIIFSPDSKKVLIGQEFNDSVRYGLFANNIYSKLNLGRGISNAIFTQGSEYIIAVKTDETIASDSILLFDLKGNRKSHSNLPFVGHVTRLLLSSDGRKMLVESGGGYSNAATIYFNERNAGAVTDFFSNISNLKTPPRIGETHLPAYPYPLTEQNIDMLDDNRLLSILKGPEGQTILLRKNFPPFANFRDAISKLKDIAPLTFEEKIENGILNIDSLSTEEINKAGEFYLKHSSGKNDSLNKFSLEQAQKLYSKLLSTGAPDDNWTSYINNLNTINNSFFEIDSNTKNYVDRSKRIIGFKEQLQNSSRATTGSTEELSSDYGNLSYYQILSGDFAGAVESAKKGLQLFPLNDWINTNLALGLLLSGKESEADVVYNKYNGRFYSDSTKAFNDAFREDIEKMEQLKLLPSENKTIEAQVQRIKKLFAVDSIPETKK